MVNEPPNIKIEHEIFGYVSYKSILALDAGTDIVLIV